VCLKFNDAEPNAQYGVRKYGPVIIHVQSHCRGIDTLFLKI